MRWDARIGRRLKLRDLHIFLAVVERGTMARAAGALSMSQPAVSKAVADMEHTLGLRLLDRSRQGVQPTAYGHALLKRGLAVFDELREGVKELQFLADPTAGELRIGSSEGMAAGLCRPSSVKWPGDIPRLSLRWHKRFSPRRIFETSMNAGSTFSLVGCSLLFESMDLLLRTCSTITSWWSPVSSTHSHARASSHFATSSMRGGSCHLQPVLPDNSRPRSLQPRI